MPMTVSAPIARLVDLEDSDQDAFCSTIRSRRRISARDDVFKEGFASRYISLILSGWAYRYKQLEDGRQQILGFLLPGDLTEASPVNGYLLDHSVGALTDLICADISHEALATVCLSRPAIQKALAGEALAMSSIQREWLMSLGQRTGTERLGHLLCELYWRLGRIGSVQAETFTLPATQGDLAAALGLSTVHVCRKFAELRELGLVQTSWKKVHICDVAQLQALSCFRPDYLYFSEALTGGHGWAPHGPGRPPAHEDDIFSRSNVPRCRRLRSELEAADFSLLRELGRSGTSHCGAGYSVPGAILKAYCQSALNCRMAALSGCFGRNEASTIKI